MLRSFLKYTVILLCVVFSTFPIYYLLVYSTLSWQEFRYSTKPILLPNIIDYSRLFSNFFSKEFTNSLIISSSATFLSIFFGTMAGYSFARFKIGGFHLPFMILSIKMLPVVAFIIPLFMLMLKLKLIDTHLAIMITHLLVTLPFAVWMMRGFFIEMPVEIEEAATIDGCSKWQILWRIALPLTAPGIAVPALFCFIFSWNEFVFALVLSRKDAITLPVVIAGTRTQFGIHWSVMTAMSAMACLPVFVIALVAQKYLVRGLTLGAIK